LIDRESESVVSGWLRLGDEAAGRKPLDGRCEHCGAAGYVSDGGKQLLCARCILELTHDQR
jgi:uncharacterized membrane protein